jgi:catechol 2,3-dioxygenase-like lactoylglutathione lyase family enzyme
MSARLTMTGIHHVRLPVSDLERSRAFWQDVLGYEWDFDFPGDDGPAASALRHPDGGPNVVLWLDAERARASAGFVWFGLGLPAAADVERLRDELDALEIPHGGIQGAFVDVKLPFVSDPDGNLISFYVKPSSLAVAPAGKA